MEWTVTPSTPWTRWAPCTTSTSKQLSKPSMLLTTGPQCMPSPWQRDWLVRTTYGFCCSLWKRTLVACTEWNSSLDMECDTAHWMVCTTVLAVRPGSACDMCPPVLAAGRLLRLTADWPLIAGEPRGEKGCSPTVWGWKGRIKTTLKCVLTGEQTHSRKFHVLVRK